ncbi:MAG: PHP domain-containing protein, partial [Chloroflexota bacterium]
MPQLRWLKGNLHTHTTNSDGDTEPEHVAEWYHEHAYDFLVLSDHNHLTILDAGPEEKARWPLLIPGEEVTAAFEERPVHIGGIGVGHLVEPQTGDSVADTIQRNVQAVRAVGGLPTINHPNYKWAIGERDIAAVEGAWGLEVYNGHHRTNDAGGGGQPGTLALWDRLLSRGKRIFGVAVDDAHHFHGEFGPRRANPGRGWVMVEAEDASENALLAAMSEGRFYGSSGVTLAEVHARGGELAISIEPEDDYTYTTVFTGRY